MIVQVDQNPFVSLFLPGEITVTYFQEPMRQGAVRWFTAQPTQITADEGFVDDQICAVTDVFQIMKANGHRYDGTGGAGDLQVNVTFQTRSGPTSELQRINILMAETI